MTDTTDITGANAAIRILLANIERTANRMGSLDPAVLRQEILGYVSQAKQQTAVIDHNVGGIILEAQRKKQQLKSATTVLSNLASQLQQLVNEL